MKEKTTSSIASPVARRVQEVLARYPKVPKDVADALLSAKTGGEVKRILKAWLKVANLPRPVEYRDGRPVYAIEDAGKVQPKGV